MRLVPTRRTDYAIQAMVFLAQHAEGRVAASTVAEGMELDVGYLHQVLGTLQRSDLVSAQRGRSGGYSLARHAETITVREIVEAVEGSLEGGECALRGGPCHWIQVCALHWVWSAARTAFADQLGSATLGQIAATDAGLAAETVEIPQTSHRR